MRPIRLNIAKPCPEDWNSMTGSEQRKHCATCDHDVVALAEMTPEEAVALVRAAPPHSLCLRIEHDDAGTVMFRQTPSRATAAPLMMLTVGASMLLTACGDSTPSNTPQTRPENVSTQSAENVKPSATDSMPAASEPNGSVGTNEKIAEAQAQTASSAAANPRAGSHNGAVQSAHKPTTRITTGCACAVGDKLCDCL